jgi:hypothetical protein
MTTPQKRATRQTSIFSFLTRKETAMPNMPNTNTNNETPTKIRASKRHRLDTSEQPIYNELPSTPSRRSQRKQKSSISELNTNNDANEIDTHQASTGYDTVSAADEAIIAALDLTALAKEVVNGKVIELPFGVRFARRGRPPGTPSKKQVAIRRYREQIKQALYKHAHMLQAGTGVLVDGVFEEVAPVNEIRVIDTPSRSVRINREIDQYNSTTDAVTPVTETEETSPVITGKRKRLASILGNKKRQSMTLDIEEENDTEDEYKAESNEEEEEEEETDDNEEEEEAYEEPKSKSNKPAASNSSSNKKPKKRSSGARKFTGLIKLDVKPKSQISKSKYANAEWKKLPVVSAATYEAQLNQLASSSSSSAAIAKKQRPTGKIGKHERLLDSIMGKQISRRCIMALRRHSGLFCSTAVYRDAVPAHLLPLVRPDPFERVVATSTMYQLIDTIPDE